VTELINKGLELNSMRPEYYYTQLAALKIEMISEATKDATFAGSENRGGVRLLIGRA
jgi:hypothetical protein